MQTIDIDQLRDIYNMAICGDEIEAIKALREATSHPTLGVEMGLGQAKAIVELMTAVRSFNNECPSFDTIVALLSVVAPLNASTAATTDEPCPAPVNVPADKELAAIATAIEALDPLYGDERKRVVDYLAARYS